MRRIILTLIALAASFAMAEDVTFQGVFNDIANAIIAKDGGSGMKPNQMANRIASLPSGDVWVKPSYWPDIRAILAADKVSANPHGLDKDNRFILLLYCDSSVQFTVNGGTTVYYEEGQTYQGNGIVKVQNQKFSFAETGYHWMIVYGNNIPNYSFLTPGDTWQRTLWMYGDEDKNSQVGCDYATALQNAYSICYLENIVINSYYRIFFSNGYSLNGNLECNSIISDTGGGGQIFTKCYNLKGVSGYLGLTDGAVRSTNYGLFTDCFHLQTLPDYLVIPKYNITASNTGFPTMYALRSLPKVLTPNTETATAMTYSFAKSILLSKDSVAKFSNGTIVDGFAAFLPVPAGHPLAGWTSDATGAAASRTFTLPEQVRAAFSSAEQTAIEEAFTAHNWTLAW